MTKASWKTTVFGVAAAIAAVIVESPELVEGHRMAILAAKVVMSVGLGGFAVFARDVRVSDEESGSGVKAKPPPQEVVIVEKIEDGKI